MESDPLLKYLAKKYDGKTISKANEAKLGALFGISVDKDNITEAKAKKIRDSLKNAGFAKGGIASTLNKVALENGDDGWVTLQRGESVLTEEETGAVKDVAKHLVKVGLPYTEEQLNKFRASLNIPIDYTDMVPKYGNTPVNTTNNASVNIRDVNIHMDGTGVTDKESFRRTLRDYDVRSDIEKIALGDVTKGSVRNAMRYI